MPQGNTVHLLRMIVLGHVHERTDAGLVDIDVLWTLQEICVRGGHAIERDTGVEQGLRMSKAFVYSNEVPRSRVIHDGETSTMDDLLNLGRRK